MPRYITVDDIRGEGFTEAMGDDDTVTNAIDLWESVWDRMTRQWFEPREATLELDGTDSDTIHFGVPIISITELYLNESDIELSTDQYKVYNGRGGTDVEDDRGNPRIKLIRSQNPTDIFTRAPYVGPLKFRKGRKNQIVVGTFGYTEADGSVPLGVQRAIRLLVLEKLLNPAIASPTVALPSMGGMTGLVTEETTDGHKRKFQPVGGPVRARPGGLNGISQNPEVRDLLRLYRAPIGIATPAHWTF